MVKRGCLLSLLALSGCTSIEAALNRAIIASPVLTNTACPPGPARIRLSESSVEKKSATPLQPALSNSEIHEVVRANLKDIQTCYQANALGLSGELKPLLRISSIGCVYESSIVESTIASVELAACVKKRVLSWKFPRPKDEKQIEVEYVFSFKGNGENTVVLPTDPSLK